MLEMQILGLALQSTGHFVKVSKWKNCWHFWIQWFKILKSTRQDLQSSTVHFSPKGWRGMALGLSFGPQIRKRGYMLITEITTTGEKISSYAGSAPNFSTHKREIVRTYSHPVSFSKAMDSRSSITETTSHYLSFFYLSLETGRAGYQAALQHWK